MNILLNGGSGFRFMNKVSPNESFGKKHKICYMCSYKK